MDDPTLRSPVGGDDLSPSLPCEGREMTPPQPSPVRGGRISSLSCEERVRSADPVVFSLVSLRIPPKAG